MIHGEQIGQESFEAFLHEISVIRFVFPPLFSLTTCYMANLLPSKANYGILMSSYSSELR
jgi:hypothetical protein